MKILITGATGFVGQTLIPQLQKQHSQVDILTLNRSVRKAEIMYPSDTYPCVKHTYADDVGRAQTAERGRGGPVHEFDEQDHPVRVGGEAVAGRVCG